MLWKIADRIIDERIKQLKAEGKAIWSYSKVNTACNCLYEYYNNYILKKQGKDSIYGFLGGSAHDCIERLYMGEIEPKDMENLMRAKILEADILGLKFPMGESEKRNWTESVLHFMRNYKKMNYPISKMEELVLVNLFGDVFIQGYVDAIFQDEEGKLHIYDWKTSSKTNFGKDKILKTGRQLAFYKASIELITGMEVVETAWNMLKFCEIHYINGYNKKTGLPKYSKLTVMRSDIEKTIIGKLGNLLEPEQFMLGQMMYVNGSLDFSCFPKYDTFQFEIKDHVIQYNVTKEVEIECLTYFVETIQKINNMDSTNQSEWLVYLSDYVKTGLIDRFCVNLCNQRENCPQYNAWKASAQLLAENE